MATEDVFDRCVSHYFRTRRQDLGEQPGVLLIPQPSRSASGWESNEYSLCGIATESWPVTGSRATRSSGSGSES